MLSWCLIVTVHISQSGRSILDVTYRNYTYRNLSLYQPLRVLSPPILHSLYGDSPNISNLVFIFIDDPSILCLCVFKIDQIPTYLSKSPVITWDFQSYISVFFTFVRWIHVQRSALVESELWIKFKYECLQFLSQVTISVEITKH